MQAEKMGKDGCTLTMMGRERLSLFGVEDVLRFDDENVVCRTTLGELVLEGRSLRIVGFSSAEGTLTVAGEILGLYYEEKKGKKGKLSGGAL